MAPSGLVFPGEPHIIRSGSYICTGWNDFGTNAHVGGGGTNGTYDRSWTSRSADDGLTWSAPVSVDGIYSVTPFIHGGELYNIGTSEHFGGIVIRKSSDNGATWGSISTLFATDADEHYLAGNFAPVFKSGRIYLSMVNCATIAGWPGNASILVLHAATTDDLTLAASWTKSNTVGFTPAWQPTWTTSPCWFESFCFEKPSGAIGVFTRCMSDPEYSSAAILDFDLGTNTTSFTDQESTATSKGWVTINSGSVLMYLIDDRATSGYYLLLHNRNTVGYCPPNQDRHVLSLSKSTDMTTWTFVQDLVTAKQGLSEAAAAAAIGWQYPCGFIEDGDLYMMVRAAYSGANSNHNNNRITFHLIPNIRANL